MPLRHKALLATLTLTLGLGACSSPNSPKAAPRVAASRAAGATPSSAGPARSSAPAHTAVAANQGALRGRVLGPTASLISDLAGGILSDSGASLIANNGAGLIGNNGGGLVANNGAGYALLAASLEPLTGARVEVVDVRGKVISRAPATTDAQGSFTVSGLADSGGLLFITATATVADRPLTLRAAVAAPRSGDGPDTVVDPAATLVAARITAAIGADAAAAEAVQPASLAGVVAATRAALNDAQAVGATVLPSTRVAEVHAELTRTVPAIALAQAQAVDPVTLAPLASPTIGAPTAGASAAPAGATLAITPAAAAPNAPLTLTLVEPADQAAGNLGGCTIARFGGGVTAPIKRESTAIRNVNGVATRQTVYSVTIPRGATSGPITLTCTSGQAVSGANLTVLGP